MSEIRFKSLSDGSFGVSLAKGVTNKSGDSVVVSKKDGTTKSVVLGDFVEENKYGDRIFKIKN